MKQPTDIEFRDFDFDKHFEFALRHHLELVRENFPDWDAGAAGIKLYEAHVKEILEHLRAGTLEGTYEPLRIYLTCYQVLRATEDQMAQEVLTTAAQLLQERAARIEDEETRRSFLENVAVHREIMGSC